MSEIENLENEVWRVVVVPELGTYPNYQISSMGRVKSLNYGKTGKERLLKLSKDEYGYLKVGLVKEGEKQRLFKVHRLVAFAFISNPDNLPCVNHKDENKSNNIVSNLEWCSYLYNNIYGTRMERFAKTRSATISGGFSKSGKPVYQYTTKGELVNIYKSGAEVEKRTGLHICHIRACCNGKKETAYGYIWSYEPLPDTELKLP